MRIIHDTEVIIQFCKSYFTPTDASLIIMNIKHCLATSQLDV